MKKILEYPNKVLKTKSEKVEKIDDVLVKEIEQLKEILCECENGAGLAANQIGVAKRFFAEKDVGTKKVTVFINPEIKKAYGEKVFPKLKGEEGKSEDFLEGCLSFPDLFGTVRRFLEIDVAWQELRDKKLIDRKEKLKGYKAIVFQHEFDHLEGILFIDRIKNDKGDFYKWDGKKMVIRDARKI